MTHTRVLGARAVVGRHCRRKTLQDVDRVVAVLVSAYSSAHDSANRLGQLVAPTSDGVIEDNPWMLGDALFDAVSVDKGWAEHGNAVVIQQAFDKPTTA